MIGRTNLEGDGIVKLSRAAIIDSTPVEGNLVRVSKAKFISLVGKPANQSPIKILRSDKGENPMSQNVIRRIRRSGDANPVLRLTFPEGSDGTTVTAAMKEYGLTGYTITQEGGVYTATRADLKSIAKDKTMEIKLTSDGLVATVSRQDGGLAVEESKVNLTMARVEFDSTKFSLEEVQRWVTEKSVDGTVQEPQNPGECYVVRRSDIPENEETRRMVLEDGVEAVIVRSDVTSIPAGYVAVVSESAYGCWGWGQLDFAASMADTEFCEQMGEALCTLSDVMRNIVVYSSLPIDVRKELANRALTQFGGYIATLLDSLPRQLLMSVVRSANPTLEKAMTQAASGATTKPAEGLQADAPITRADVQKLITEGIAAALEVQRAAATTTPVAGNPAKPVEATLDAGIDPTLNPDGTKKEVVRSADATPITRADLTDFAKTLAETMATAIKPVTDRVASLEGTTVVRSAPEADNTAPVIAQGEQVKKDVFRGALPGLRSVK